MPKKKERSTWGSKRKRGKNSWELRYPLPGNKPGHETFHGTAKEADRRLSELRIQYEGMAPTMTLSEFWDNYYHDHILEHLAESTIPGYENEWFHDVKPAFGHLTLPEITPRRIQAWLDTMTHGKAKHAKGVLSSMLTRAVALELVDENPAALRYVLPTAKAKSQRSKEIYSKVELDGIFLACRGEIWEAAFILSAFGGASREEAMSPKLSEIQFVDGVAIVPIVRGIQRLKGEVRILDWTKTKDRKRDLVILPPYSTRLEEIVKEYTRNGYTWLTDDGFGNPRCPNTVANRLYKNWFGRQQFRYIPFSNLRHAYATYTAQNVHPMMLAKLLGHSQPTTTYNNYYRPTTEDKIAALLKS